MPDDTPAHSYQTSLDIVELAPNSEVTPYPWTEPQDLLSQTIKQVRDFLLMDRPSAKTD